MSGETKGNLVLDTGKPDAMEWSGKVTWSLTQRVKFRVLLLSSYILPLISLFLWALIINYCRSTKDNGRYNNSSLQGRGRGDCNSLPSGKRS